jgi:hypothetical protein
MAAGDTTIASARQTPASRSMSTTSCGQGRRQALDNKPDHDNHEPLLLSHRRRAEDAWQRVNTKAPAMRYDRIDKEFRCRRKYAAFQ